MATTPTYPSNIGGIAKTILPADTTALVDVYDNSAVSYPVRCEALNITSNDTATMNVAFSLHNGSASFLLGTARAVTLSGTDGAAARINALAVVGNISPDGIPVIEIPPGFKLQANVLVAVTSAKTVTITGWVRKFA
jgi:hypothetical protein